GWGVGTTDARGWTRRRGSGQCWIRLPPRGCCLSPTPPRPPPTSAFGSRCPRRRTPPAIGSTAAPAGRCSPSIDSRIDSTASSASARKLSRYKRQRRVGNKTRGEESMNRNWRKRAILASLVALLLTATPVFGQAKSETTKQDRANVFLRFAKDGTVSASCSETLGLITQSMLKVEGVKNVKIDSRNNGLQVSYDPGKTTPQRIVTAFNKENPDTLLQSSSAKEVK